MANQTTSKGVHITLWVLQVALAGMFLMAGSSKLFNSIEELSKMLPWVMQVPAGLVRFIGLSELLGGVGLILPSALRIRPHLAVVAAYGLGLVQVLAAIFHITRGETEVLGFNAVLLLIAIIIGWGRSSKAPITPKGADA